MKRNPRPRKYESAAARQAAYKARAEMLEFRAEPKTAATLTSIAEELDVSRSELLLSMVKFALTNHDWARFGLTHKTLPYYQGNPIMATKKASPAQLAARKKFAEMARSGAFKKAKRAADRDKNPMNMYTVLHRGTSNIAGQIMASSPKQAKEKIAEKLGLATTSYLMATKSSQVRINPSKRKKTVSQKISQLVHEGYPQKQAVAVALSEKRAGKVKNNPMGKSIAGQHLFNLGSNYFAAVTLTGYNDYYAQVFYRTTDSSGFTDDQIVPDYKPRHFATAKAAINSVMKYATKNKLKSNPIAEMREFTVMKWKRGKNTTNGNPVYEFILKDEFGGMHTGKTKPNAGWVYAISSVYEGDKINAALEETKGGRVYMVDYGKRKSNPVKRSSRSAVVPNPRAKKPQKVYSVSIMQDGLHTKWMGLANFFTFAEAENYSRYLSKQHPNWAIRVHDNRAMK